VAEKLRFELLVDADASKVVQLRQAVEQLEGKMGEKLPVAAGKASSALGAITSVAGWLGVAAAATSFVASIIRGSEVFEQMTARFNIWKAGFSGMVDQAAKDWNDAPLRYKAFQDALVKFHKERVTQLTASEKAWAEEHGRIMNKAAEGTKITSDWELQAVLTNTRLLTADISSGVDARLEALRAGEAKAVELLMNTGGYLELRRAGEKGNVDAAKHAEQMIADMHSDFGQQRKRLTLSQHADQIQIVEEGLKAELALMSEAAAGKNAILEQELVDTVTTNSRKLALVAELAQSQRDIENAAYTERMDALDEEAVIAPERLAEINAKKETLAQEHAARMGAIRRKESSDTIKLENETRDKVLKAVNDVTSAATLAGARRLASTHSTHKALQALGDAGLIEAGKQAGDFIKTQAYPAAAAAYKWGATWGGPIGGAASAAIAYAAVMALAAGAQVGAQAAVGTGEGGLAPAGAEAPGAGDLGGGGGGTYATTSAASAMQPAGPAQYITINLHGYTSPEALDTLVDQIHRKAAT